MLGWYMPVWGVLLVFHAAFKGHWWEMGLRDVKLLTKADFKPLPSLWLDFKRLLKSRKGALKKWESERQKEREENWKWLFYSREKQGVIDKTVDITAGKQLPLGTAVGHRNVLWHRSQWDKGLAAQCYIQSWTLIWPLPWAGAIACF